jgi:hypothetical protein
MLSEWLVHIPEDLPDLWYLVPCPEGRRTLVVATGVSYQTYGLFYVTNMLLRFVNFRPLGFVHTSYILLQILYSCKYLLKPIMCNLTKLVLLHRNSLILLSDTASIIQKNTAFLNMD